MQAPMSIRAGLIGYGLGGRLLHAPLIAAAGIDIAAIVTSRAEQARADFPNAAVLPDIEAALARDDIDVAIIVTPDHLHAAHARAALEAGKHVVVDKPFTSNSDEARALIALAEQRGRMLTCYHNRRWDADFLTLRKLVNEGALGELVFYSERWDRYRPQARGDWHDDHMIGELYGLGPHLLDHALVLFGPPDWISADIYNQRGLTRHNDGFEILMGKGRARIHLGINMLGADEERSFRVLGTEAAFVKRGLDPQEPRLRARQPASAEDFGVEDEKSWGVLTDGATQKARTVPSERGAWVNFYKQLRTAIETGGSPPVDPRDAARVIALLEAAMQSSETGKRVEIAAFFAERGL